VAFVRTGRGLWASLYLIIAVWRDSFTRSDQLTEILAQRLRIQESIGADTGWKQQESAI